jgi:pimeloyl-ACP methyl ester carboxylesterase
MLFIHGATFPSRLAAAYPFGGESWMAHLARRGCDVWALDFLGYGDSDRYPQMGRGEQSGAPLGRASDAANQISRTVDFIMKKTHARSVVLIAHSWGTLPAALFTIRAPDRVTRLVLFGPVSQGAGSEPIAAPSAYHDVTIEQQQRRFDGYVPPGEPLLIDRTELQEWSAAYLASDLTSGSRNPPSVRVPMGPVSDADDASSGHLAYDPRRIHVPTLIVYGEWDEVTRDADAAWLARQIGRPDVRVRKLPRGTHVMHLESSRVSLRAAVDDFLADAYRQVAGVSTARSASFSPSN